MGDFYVANVTTKNRQFAYRLPENPKVFQQEILAGQQAMVMRNATVEDIAAVMRQCEPYGIVNQGELKRVSPTQCVEMVYSLDAPVKVEAFMLAQQHNRDTLIQRGAEFRVRAAIGNFQFATDQNVGIRENEIAVTELNDKLAVVNGGLQHTVAVKPNQATGRSRRKAA